MKIYKTRKHFGLRYRTIASQAGRGALYHELHFGWWFFYWWTGNAYRAAKEPK